MDEAKLGEFMGRVEAKLDSIGEKLDSGADKMRALDTRTRRLEIRLGALWIVGPLLLAVVAFAGDLAEIFRRH